MGRTMLRLLPGSQTMARAGRLVTTLLGASVLLGALAGVAAAGSSERQGTEGANELRIPVGPRSTALGGTTVSDVSGPEALFWNPAGIAGEKKTNVYFSHLSYIADMNVNYFAIVTKAGEGNLGFSAKMLDVGDVIVTTEAAPDGTGDILSPVFATLGVSYARQFTDRVRFGATAQFVNETVDQARARGLAFDFGFQYDTGTGGPTFGFTMKNFGTSMSFTGSAFEVNLPIPDAEPGSSNRTVTASSSSFEMPSYFQIGGAYDLLNRREAGAKQRLRVLGTFSSNNFTPDEFHGGTEYSYHDLFALRAGYGSRVSDRSTDVYNGFSYGAGMNFKLGSGSTLQFDYANRVVKNFFSDTNEFAVKLSF